MGYCLSACAKTQGTVCLRVKIHGVLFVRMCKSTGYCLSACAKMTEYYSAGVLFVQHPHYHYVHIMYVETTCTDNHYLDLDNYEFKQKIKISI